MVKFRMYFIRKIPRKIVYFNLWASMEYKGKGIA